MGVTRDYIPPQSQESGDPQSMSPVNLLKLSAIMWTAILTAHIPHGVMMAAIRLAKHGDDVVLKPPSQALVSLQPTLVWVKQIRRKIVGRQPVGELGVSK